MYMYYIPYIYKEKNLLCTSIEKFLTILTKKVTNL